MLKILSNRTYRNLFSAQVIALIGTGLATVALGLLAHDLAGADAGAVLGTALAIKMGAYIVIAPIVGAFANSLPRRAFLIAMDLLRTGVALCLPFVDQVWQVFVLIFVLQSASAAFTPTFQATIPDVLPDERDYTRALSLSRLAYDMENLTSPLLAGLLLLVMNFHALFSGTAIGFLASALLVFATTLPSPAISSGRKEKVLVRLTRGMRQYLGTPRLRGMLAVTLSAAAASAMVIVNTVVIVREQLGLGTQAYAMTLAAYGAGSMAVAFILPKLLERLSDRSAMMTAAAALSATLIVLSGLSFFVPGGMSWPIILVGWLILGAAYSMAVTPSGRLLRRSSSADGRPAIFAAQFSLSHICWLLAYPLAGWTGSQFGLSAAFAASAGLAVIGVLFAWWLWPTSADGEAAHQHPDLPPDHPHLTDHHKEGQSAHAFVIDDLHRRWPSPTR
ncbi:MAG: major facilitator transporter [Hyphomonadaceae bacterium BRH_c29]|nr:MAG: major facilitator transporter [Hyphomonadaceae bacterium BRH_c29]